MKWRARGRTVNFPRRPLLMGIVNVNDDSFCGDGSVEPEMAVDQARRMAADGADLIDLGAESARTNRSAISAGEEVDRLRPVLRRLAEGWDGLRPRDGEQLWPPLISVNTWRPEVVEAVLPLGVEVVSDLSGLESPENAALCVPCGAALLIMHTVGLPKVPHLEERYDDVWSSLTRFFEERVERARAAGLSDDRLILDPGLDFAKQRDDNLRILAGLERLTHRHESPVLLPISRKTVIGEVLDLPEPRERDAGTVACLVVGVRRGAKIFRVHEVRGMFEALKTIWAVEGGNGRRSGAEGRRQRGGIVIR